ncbi:MAG: T9SS type A sorting domain-containing protein [Saprospiraceae bacterium]|nr:MAG: T9SS type A sorting domain-containing protein [Saprospiraceae bacterium]
MKYAFFSQERNWRLTYVFSFLLMTASGFTLITKSHHVLDGTLALMTCNDPEPVTRWNKLSAPERDSLDDTNPLTNVHGFPSGFCDSMDNSITVDITASGAPHSILTSDINNDVPGRWGMSSFNNGRTAATESGNKYCFTFSSAVPFSVNSLEHSFFNDGEHVWVTAFDGMTPVALTGMLHGAAGPASVTGNGTPEVHFAANNKVGRGLWWEASTDGTPITTICVEYYREGASAALLSTEPFTLNICNTNRCLFDDPFAATDPDNPNPGAAAGLVDQTGMSKTLVNAAPAASGVAGNVDATWRLTITNVGNASISNLQVLENFGEQIPETAFAGFAGATFGPGSNATVSPSFNGSFDGLTNTTLFNGTSGTLDPGQQLVVDLAVELAPSNLQTYGSDANSVWFTGTDPAMQLVSATSDALTGIPGDTGGPVDATLLFIPSVNASKLAQNLVANCTLAPGNEEVEIVISIQNTGNVNLDNLTLTEDLAAQLGPAFVALKNFPSFAVSTATANPIFNPAFTGSGTHTQVFNGQSGLLEPGQVLTLFFKIELNPNAPGTPAPLTNQATVSARGLDPSGQPLPGNIIVTDLTDTGSQPSTSNAGQPGDTGGHDDPTLLTLPGVQAAKYIAGVDVAHSGIAGHFDVIFEVILKNTGNVDLTNLSLMDNLSLASQFGTAFLNVVTAPQIVTTGAYGTATTTTTDPGLNATYNGIGDLLTGGGLLKPGQVLVVQYTVEIKPSAPGAPASPKNTVEAFASGTGPGGTAITIGDTSDSGYLPESSNPGRPGDTGGHCDPTPLGNCWDVLGNGITCNTHVQVSLDQTCVAGLTPNMILEGEFEQCTGDDLYPLGAYYDMMVTTLFGLPIPDGNLSTPNIYEIDGSYAGQTLTVKVSDVVHQNNCWGQITLEDKLAPVINCVTPVEVSCTTSFANLPAPNFADNCDANATLSLAGEQILDNDICDDGVYRISRTYNAKDNMGNTSPNCVVVYELVRSGVNFPADINWTCQQYNAYPGITGVAPLNAAITDTDPADSDVDVAANLQAGILQNTGSGSMTESAAPCKYMISHSDQVVADCGNSFKITRTWTALDWCTNQILTAGTNGEDNIQWIKILDKTPPAITRPPFAISANIPAQHPQVCRSTGFLPPPVFSDDCNSVTIQIITPVGEAEYINGANGNQGGFVPLPGLPLGTQIVTYKAVDACGNETQIAVPVNVIDGLTPTAVCDAITDVSLTTDGTAKVFAATFDGGTHDNCCLDHFEVRLMADNCNDGVDNTVFSPSVTFCCEDVTTSPATVVFRAYDCFGNFNDCMVQIEIRDKTSPATLSCPPAQVITCDWYDDHLRQQLDALSGNQDAQSQLLNANFGAPVFMDNCTYDVLREISINLSPCLEGTIVRTWTATDAGANSPATCTQTIHINHVSDWVVNFPPHLQFSCGDWLPDLGEPQVFYDNCEMIAISYEDLIYTTVPDACYKIVRKWAVINWCVVGEQVNDEVVEQPENQLGLPFPQCDLDGDGDCDDRTFRDSWRSGPAANRPGAAQAAQATYPDTDPDSDPWDGFIYFEQVIKVVDETDPVFTNGCAIADTVLITDTTCVATVLLPTPDITDCSPLINVAASGDLGAGLGPFLNVSPGTYSVTYSATDNCNNSSTCATTITVADGKKPVAFCVNGLAIELMVANPPMITVHAKDFDKASFDNCSGDLLFSFSSNVLDTTRTYFCQDTGVNNIEMWVTDLAGNQDFCETFIDVQSNLGQCSDDTLVVHVGGTITDENDGGVNNVEVSLSGQNNGMVFSGPGGFQFTGIVPGTDVTLTPAKNDGPLNGVSTFDLVLISKHILGVEALDSPYKIIAADANKSNSVTTYDLVEIRKLILFINDDFTNNHAWRFVNKNYVFPNPANPWAEDFPEIININNVPGDVLNANFTAIKVGDVNNSATGDSFAGTGDRTTNGLLIFDVKDETFSAGQTVSINFEATEFAVSGFQFTLEFDPRVLTLDDIQPGLANPANFGVAMSDVGILTCSWNSDEVTSLPQGSPVFSLSFTARQSGSLRNLLRINSRYTAAEAYPASSAGSHDIMDVALSFGEAPVVAEFELYQNRPNPFRQTTTIAFNLPQVAVATLTLIDASGNIVKQVKGEYAKGYNEIEINRNELGATGLFYYRLETSGNTAVRRAVLID